MKVFLAAPFTDKINPKTRLVHSEYRAWLEKIADGLRKEGHEVFFAHEREKWGQKLDTPEEALSIDWEELRKSDVVLAYVGNPPSPGVQMELGYASALLKPIVIFKKNNEEFPYLTQGIGSTTKVIFKELIDSENIYELIKSVKLIVKKA